MQAHSLHSPFSHSSININDNAPHSPFNLLISHSSININHRDCQPNTRVCTCLSHRTCLHVCRLEEQVKKAPQALVITQVLDLASALTVVKQLRAKGPALFKSLLGKVQEMFKAMRQFMEALQMCDKLDASDVTKLEALPQLMNSTSALISKNMGDLRLALTRVESNVLPALANCRPVIDKAIAPSRCSRGVSRSPWRSP